MGVQVNSKGKSHALSLVASGKVDKNSSWSFSAEDGNKLLGPNGDDWENYGQFHLGEDTAETEKTKARYKYPFGKDGKVYRSGVVAAKQRAAAQGQTDIENAANDVLQKIDGESKNYFTIKAQADESADISIYGDIGEGFFSEGVGAKKFADELKALGNVKKLNISINSPGGSVFEGLAIYNKLRMHQAQKTVTVDGLAASIASVIAMAGDTVVMPENALMMIHDPWSLAVGNADEMRKTAEVLDKMKDSLVMAYMGKSHMTEEEIRRMMTDETWMNGNDALEKGFADECTKPKKIAASFDLSKFRNAPQSVFIQPPAPAAPKTTNKSKEVRKMKCKKHPGVDMIADVCPSCEHEAAQARALKETRENELNRVKALRAIGKEFKMPELAEYAVEEDWTEDQLRVEVLDRIKKANAGNNGPIHIKVSPAHEGKPFRNLGEQLIAIKSAAQGSVDPRLHEVFNAATGAGENTDSDAGFLIQTDFTTSLLSKSNDTMILAPRCQHINLTGNRLEAPVVDETSRATGSRWGGVRIYRAAEAAQVTKSKPKLAMLEMKLEKIMGIFYASDELLSDAAALESIASQAFVEEFGFKVDDEILRGTGAGEMLGILNAPALVSVTKETGQLAATIDAQNIIKMYARMPARSKPNAVWLINSECMPQIMNLSLILGTAAVPLYFPPGGISASPYGTIFGKPVIEIEQASALGTKGDIMFVDLAQYAIIEKGGINAASSIHVQFLTDEMTYRWTARNNGQPVWKSALTPYKGSATLSPFVSLDTRA